MSGKCRKNLWKFVSDVIGMIEIIFFLINKNVSLQFYPYI